MELIYYAADYVVLRSDLPMRKFAGYFVIYGLRVSPIDRTGTLRFPVKTKSLFPIPQMQPMDVSYETVCNARALELLTASDCLDLPLHVFWSGGVDSTTALVSLIKMATPAQRERLVVLLSEDSINEYPL